MRLEHASNPKHQEDKPTSALKGLDPTMPPETAVPSGMVPAAPFAPGNHTVSAPAADPILCAMEPYPHLKPFMGKAKGAYPTVIKTAPTQDGEWQPTVIIWPGGNNWTEAYGIPSYNHSKKAEALEHARQMTTSKVVRDALGRLPQEPEQAMEVPGIKFGTINEFNTGRHYSNAGQPIKWATFNVEGVAGVVYKDRARMITKVIPLPGVEGHTCHLGEIKPRTVYGTLGNDYVHACEMAGIYHNETQKQYENGVGYPVTVESVFESRLQELGRAQASSSVTTNLASEI